MADEYKASPLEQLIPSKLSRWLAGALILSLCNVLYLAWGCFYPLTQGKPTEISQVWLLSGGLLTSLALALAMLLDLSLLYKAKKHSRIIYHHVTK